MVNSKKLAAMWVNENSTILLFLTDIYGIAKKKA
jgi:hypothetical protein